MPYANPFAAITDPIGRTLLETEPQSSYQMWLQAHGYSPTTGRGAFDYGQGLFDYYQRGYVGASAQEPTLKWTDYLDRLATGGGLSEMLGSRPRQSSGIRWMTGPFGQR